MYTGGGGESRKVGGWGVEEGGFEYRHRICTGSWFCEKTACRSSEWNPRQYELLPDSQSGVLLMELSRTPFLVIGRLVCSQMAGNEMSVCL